jgi:hypothetical protein
LIEAQVGDEIIDPLYRTEFIAHDSKLDRIDWPLGAIKFPCVILRWTDHIVSDNGLPTYCFETDRALLGTLAAAVGTKLLTIQ